jgi:hypothetical protein
MKKLASQHTEKSQQRLTLHRETLRRLDAQEMEQAAGGATAWYTCELTTKQPQVSTTPTTP